MTPVRVTLIGLGAIGRAFLGAILDRDDVVVAAAADPAAGIAGRDVGELAGGAARGVIVQPTAQAAYASAPSEVAVLCTSSWASVVAPQVIEAASAARHVVTTCEELCFPPRHVESSEIDRAARRHGVAVVAAGVNPGLVMDRLPLLCAQACVRVERVHVVRIVDVAKRRVELQRKVGAGLTLAELEERRRRGRFGHVGLAESALLVAEGIRMIDVSLEEELGPVLAQDGSRGVAAGAVLGIRQRASARERGSRREVVLELEMSLRHPAPRDQVDIEGDPPVSLVIPGGVMGDRATLGTVVNALALVRSAPPGLHTVTDLPLFGLLREPAGGLLA